MTNHPSAQWGVEQRSAAEQYGQIVDVPFPNVPSEWTAEQVQEEAQSQVERIIGMKPDAVLCQGEMTMTYAIVSALLKRRIRVLAACSERIAEETQKADGTAQKTALFVFSQFREYRDIRDQKERGFE